MNVRHRYIKLLHTASLLWGALLTIAVIYSGALGNKLVADSWVFVSPHTFFETCAFFFKSIIPLEWNALWLRPIPMFLFWLDAKLWPGTAWGPHLINIILHIINTWLIWEIIRFMSPGLTGKTGDRTHRADALEHRDYKSAFTGGLPALIAVLVYGLHPLTVGSVAWIAARFDVMSVTFGLAALLLLLKYNAGINGKRWPFGVAVMLLLSILSKEQGVVFLVVCILISSLRFFSKTTNRRKELKGIVLPGILLGLYFIYRFFIFRGIGGYEASVSRGLNFLIPVYYFFTLLFPFMNSMPEWTVSWTLPVAVILLGATIAVAWKSPYKEKPGIPRIFILSSLALFIMGLLTTAPHAFMTFEMIMGHDESRFALIPITGLALLAGIGVHIFIRTPFLHRIVLMLVFLIGTVALWRIDVQIQSWRSAGLIAESIIRQTLELAPSPPPGSHLLFFDVPRNNDQHAYIFGIGLKEALIERYNGRHDLVIIRFPKREDLRIAIPERDFVFQYHNDTGILEKLKATRKKDIKSNIQ